MRSKLIPTVLLVLILGAAAFVGSKVIFAANGPCTPKEPTPRGTA